MCQSNNPEIRGQKRFRQFKHFFVKKLQGTHKYLLFIDPAKEDKSIEICGRSLTDEMLLLLDFVT